MNITENKTKSLEELSKLKVKDLKDILREYGEPTTGKKADLILRCQVVQNRGKVQQTSKVTLIRSEKEIVTYKTILKDVEKLEWSADLRKLPLFHLVQLYDYLVVSMNKKLLQKSGGFKKLKSLKFFREGHIKKMLCCVHNEFVYLKAQVVASMKSKAYSSIVCFDQDGNIKRAACECVQG